MPETISVEGFVRSVSESGLLSEADLRTTSTGWGAKPASRTPGCSRTAWSMPGG